MKNFIFKLKRLVRTLGIALLSIASLYATTGLIKVNADVFDIPSVCMADAYLNKPGNSLPKDALNCTANDIEITAVTPEPRDGGWECEEGIPFELTAFVTIQTNASSRWDTTFYLPLTDASPQVVQNNAVGECTVLVPEPGAQWIDPVTGDPISGQVISLDEDGCGDIKKPPESYTVLSTFMMQCEDSGDGRALFNYCAAWDNRERSNCAVGNPDGNASSGYTFLPGQIPNTKSKCNCDSFPIDVFIKPSPPDILKTLESTHTMPAPNGEEEREGIFDFEVSFTNTNAMTSLFITHLFDKVDINGDGTYDKSFDLWGSTTTITSSTPDGVYLTGTNCTQPHPSGFLLGEILHGTEYKCQFEVTILNSIVPTPIPYDDVVLLNLKDKNGNDINKDELDPESCPDYFAGNPDPIPGQFCSDPETVQMTNIIPTIHITKVASPTTMMEIGGIVTYTIEIFNDSNDFDSPLTLTYLDDTAYDDLLADDDECGLMETSIAFGGSVICTFTKFHSGNVGDTHPNTVTAKAKDNDNSESLPAMANALVTITDTPSSITLTKTALVPPNPLETGDDPDNYSTVDYKFEFRVDTPAVDNVTFSSLEDLVDGETNPDILTGDCDVTIKNGAALVPSEPLLNFVLMPGEWASCIIGIDIQGNAGESHKNTATIDGDDEDGQYVFDSDNEIVMFDPVDPATEMKFASSMLVVVELHNAGVENVTLKTMTVDGQSVFTAYDGAFRMDSLGGDFDIVNNPPFGACVNNTVLYYDGILDGSDTYRCAFTLEFIPGLEDTDPMDFLEDLIVIVEDNDGATSTNDVTIRVLTVE
ncbi:MAG: hypothetical protein HRT51_07290 [Colwellia sp.]|nr:hypothetical protein [Colwellia sp.]